MTIRDFSKLIYLKKEIAAHQRQLDELEQSLELRQALFLGLREFSLGAVDDAMRDEMEQCRQLLETSMKKSLAEYKRLVVFISEIDDSLIRQVVFFRFIQGLTWTQTAAEVGGGNNADSIRMMVKRYLAKCKG